MDDSVRSTFSPRSRSTLSSTSALSVIKSNGKLNAVHIVLKSAQNVVERYEVPIPVRVEEAFAFSERNTVITAQLTDCYAWVVCSRRLYIWQFGQSLGPSKQKLFPHCYELQLPQSDLAHRAELITVFFNKDTNSICCIAVSPEGMVRYWSDISHEHVSVDQHVDLQGQECDRLIYAQNFGCIIVTTTCTIVLAQVKQGHYGSEVECHTLKAPGSWLGGIGRRVSSIFFGPIASDQGTETRIIRLLAVSKVQHSYTIFVLAGCTLQKWILSNNLPENLEWSTEIAPLVRDSFRLQISHWDICDPTDVDVWILDIQEDREGILMLTAAVNLQISPQVYYALIALSTKSLNPPTQIKDFLLLKISSLYREDNPTETLSYKFLLCGNNAYLYNSKSITVINPEEEPDTLEFHHPQDHIFGGTVWNNRPVFLSRQHGLVGISSVDSDGNISLVPSNSVLESSALEKSFTGSNNLSVYQMDPDEVSAAHKDTPGQLKAAFIFHVKQQLSECQEIIGNLFPKDMVALSGVDAPLDVVVINMSKEILDDIPLGDPRWAKEGERYPSMGLGSSHSIKLLHQIIGKQKAHNLYLKFLKETGLRKKFAAVTVRGVTMTTVQALAENSEKIVAAIVLNEKSSSLIDDALEQAVKKFSKPNEVLSNCDVFFREISRICEGILCISDVCETFCHSSISPNSVAQCIHEANEIILDIFDAVLQYRQQNSDSFRVNKLAKNMHLEYLPWTATEGSEGLMDTLLQQHSLTVNYGIKVVEGQLKDILANDLVKIIDLILEGRKSHLESLKNTSREKVLRKKFYSTCNKLIKPLVQEQAWEQATTLAEKYLDFETLVLVCESTENEERLDEYKRRFKDTNFAEYVYNWYLKRGKHAKLLNRIRRPGDVVDGQDKLKSFLSAHMSLYWIQQIFDNEISAAAETLQHLNQTETELVRRKKTMLSLSKLAKLAAPEDANSTAFISGIDKQLKLVYFQECLPDYVMQQYGYDPLNPSVIPLAKLIALHICPEYLDSTEVDFKRALTIANFIDVEEERVEAILQIWRSALLRDTWNISNVDSPLEYVQNTMFFKIAELSVALGDNPNNLLPPIDMLIDHSSLQRLNESKTFEFLLKTGYDHFYRTHML